MFFSFLTMKQYNPQRMLLFYSDPLHFYSVLQSHLPFCQLTVTQYTVTLCLIVTDSHLHQHVKLRQLIIKHSIKPFLLVLIQLNLSLLNNDLVVGHRNYLLG